MERISEIVKAFTSPVITAGRYAYQIQKQVHSRNPKEQYDNPFGQALTDADVSVQSYLEVSALTICPEYGFFGEEYADSLNMKYFPKDAEVTLLLDPVDGTRYYKDGQDLFSVVLSVVSKEQFLGALVYVAAKDVLYYAVKGEGTHVVSGTNALTGDVGKKVSLDATTGKLLTYDLEWARTGLEGEFSFIDIMSAYDPAGFKLGLPSQLEGTVSCMVRKGGSLIDWGAFAFLGQEAGGIATDFAGNPLPRIDSMEEYTLPTLVVSSNEEIHAAAIKGLAEVRG